MFYGLDSFEGFPENNHPYFQDKNFETDYSRLKKLKTSLKIKYLLSKVILKNH